MSKVYDPVDESDPVWPEFSKWLDKHNAAKAKKLARSKTPNGQLTGNQGREHEHR